MSDPPPPTPEDLPIEGVTPADAPTLAPDAPTFVPPTPASRMSREQVGEALLQLYRDAGNTARRVEWETKLRN